MRVVSLLPFAISVLLPPPRTTLFRLSLYYNALPRVKIVSPGSKGKWGPLTASVPLRMEASALGELGRLDEQVGVRVRVRVRVRVSIGLGLGLGLWLA